MDVDELIGKAWKSVEAAGVPASSQAVALKEAIDFLRTEAEGGAAPRRQRATSGTGSSKRSHSKGSGGNSAASQDGHEVPDEAEFLAHLSSESDVPVEVLGDVLRLKADGSVTVTQPARKLGKNIAEQARTVTALVAGARGKGLGERPVDAAAVKAEVEKKHAYESKNYLTNHVGRMVGFNGGDRGEILLASKWIEDFRVAVATATGWSPGE